jgi:hypothetical protein
MRAGVPGGWMGFAIADRHEDTSHRYIFYFTEIGSDNSGAFYAELLVCVPVAELESLRADPASSFGHASIGGHFRRSVGKDAPFDSQPMLLLSR